MHMFSKYKQNMFSLLHFYFVNMAFVEKLNWNFSWKDNHMNTNSTFLRNNFFPQCFIADTYRSLTHNPTQIKEIQLFPLASIHFYSFTTTYSRLAPWPPPMKF